MRAWLTALLFLLASFAGCDLAPAQTVSNVVYIAWQDLTTEPMSNLVTMATPLAITSSSTNVTSLNPRKFTNDSTGTAWITNLVPGYYTLELDTVDVVTPLTIHLTNFTGIYNALELTAVPTNADSYAAAYTISAANAKFVMLPGTNIPNGYIPIATNGGVIWVTNAGGGGLNSIVPLALGGWGNNVSNLIPAGAIYSDGATTDMELNGPVGDATYAVPIIPGQQYVLEDGPNDDTQYEFYCASTATPGYFWTVGTNLYGFLNIEPGVPFTPTGWASNTIYILALSPSTPVTATFKAVNTNLFAGNFAGSHSGNGTNLNLHGNTAIDGNTTITGQTANVATNRHSGITIAQSGLLVIHNAIRVSGTAGDSMMIITSNSIANNGMGMSVIIPTNDQYIVATQIDGTHFTVNKPLSHSFTNILADLNPNMIIYYDVTDGTDGISGAIDGGGSYHCYANANISGIFLHDQIRGSNYGWLQSVTTLEGVEAYGLYNFHLGNFPFQVSSLAPFNSQIINSNGDTAIRGALINENFGDLVIGGGVSATTNVQHRGWSLSIGGTFTNGIRIPTNSVLTGPIIASGDAQVWNSNGFIYWRTSRVGATNRQDTLLAAPP